MIVGNIVLVKNGGNDLTYGISKIHSVNIFGIKLVSSLKIKTQKRLEIGTSGFLFTIPTQLLPEVLMLYRTQFDLHVLPH